MLEENKKLFQNIRSLNLPIGEYAIFGSGPIGIRDLRKINDIDVIVTEKIFNKYLDKPGWEIKYTYNNGHRFERLTNDDLVIEMWKDWYVNWNVKKLIKEAEIIEDMPFVKLEYLIKWKKFLSREKDLIDLELIDDYLYD